MFKDAYYTKWDGDKHLTAFGKRIDDDQKALVCSDVTIVDKDKLQFYLEEIYNSNHFDKNEMLDWEKKSTAVKSNYTNAKTHFEDLVKATNTYKQNAGGGTTSRNKYKSVNQLADCGNEIHEYISKIVSAVGANNKHATNTQFETMSAQIKALTNTVAKLMAKMSSVKQDSKNVNSNTGGRVGRDGGKKCPQMKKLCNMGAYCHSHGFHLVATTITETCTHKLDGHKDDTTWTNRMEGKHVLAHIQLCHH